MVKKNTGKDTNTLSEEDFHIVGYPVLDSYQDNFYKYLPYPEQIAYRKGAFTAIVALLNTVECFETGVHHKLIPKKVYTLLKSFLKESAYNLDELLMYHGFAVIIDKNNNCKRISDDEYEERRARNRKACLESMQDTLDGTKSES